MSDLIAQLHAVNTWRELAFRAVDEITRLRAELAIADEAAAINAQDSKDWQAVVDAARNIVYHQHFDGVPCIICDAVRAMDGEP